MMFNGEIVATTPASPENQTEAIMRAGDDATANVESERVRQAVETAAREVKEGLDQQEEAMRSIGAEFTRPSAEEVRGLIDARAREILGQGQPKPKDEALRTSDTTVDNQDTILGTPVEPENQTEAIMRAGDDATANVESERVRQAVETAAREVKEGLDQQEEAMRSIGAEFTRPSAEEVRGLIDARAREILGQGQTSALPVNEGDGKPSSNPQVLSEKPKPKPKSATAKKAAAKKAAAKKAAAEKKAAAKKAAAKKAAAKKAAAEKKGRR